MHWILVMVIIVVGAGRVLLRAEPPPGRVLYLRLWLTPYVGSAKEIQYWIDLTNDRVRYAEAMPPAGPIQAIGNARPLPASRLTWYVITLHLRPTGACAVIYTTLLDSSERGDPFACAGLLALKDVRGLRFRALTLWHRYRSHVQAAARTIRIPIPTGTDLIPLVADRHNMKYGYEVMAPGVLVLDRASGWPLSISGYRRDGATMTTYILEARDLPPGTLANGFFEPPPPFSLADRAPSLYRWLHDILPWHP